ncbi:hypothetical protein [Yoonia sp. I 8.24]|uniref:hypothetical protein n=1 Tax=Yoonia sp. I 8.24 TaxID=1537229 RepID=UPI001EE0A5A5|nr:hypothetical protein [Yoonia sp. I 8.24]MCG3267358.1 hypothetical protein [Yoonia sp. I 8.24]
MSTTQHVDKTSAEDKSIGFDFQYYYFLNRLLQLKKGETLGLEVMDDVHCDLSNDRQILVQLKFTTQTKKDGDAKNLTSLDKDFWKTTSNWVEVITDKNAGRKGEAEQLKFAQKSDFLLCSNKSDNSGNVVLSSIRAFQKNECTHNELQTSLNDLKGATKDKDVINYIKNVLALSKEVSKAFFTNIAFDLGCSTIIEDCKENILGFMVPSDRVDDVFHSLDSQLRADNFDLVASKQKIIISYDDFLKKYQVHFDKARNGKLVVRTNFSEPKEIGEQLFIKQLIEIGDVSVGDTDFILKMLYNQLLAKTNLHEWVNEGVVSSIDADDLEENALATWENIHRKKFRHLGDGDDINQLAQCVLDEIRSEKLSIADQEMNIRFSNGEYYDLCEDKKIGWRNDWKEKYT